MEEDLKREMVESGIGSRVLPRMQEYGRVILNSKPVEALSEEEIQDSPERFAAPTGNNNKERKKIYPLISDRELMDKVRGAVKNAIVMHGLLEGIAPAKEVPVDSRAAYIRRQKIRVKLLESTLYSVAGGTENQLLHRDMPFSWNNQALLCFVGLMDSTRISFVPGSHQPDYMRSGKSSLQSYSYDIGDIMFFMPAMLHSGHHYSDAANCRVHFYCVLSENLNRFKGENAYFAEVPVVRHIKAVSAETISARMVNLPGSKEAKKRARQMRTHVARKRLREARKESADQKKAVEGVEEFKE